jgi:hypothetical protein
MRRSSAASSSGCGLDRRETSETDEGFTTSAIVDAASFSEDRALFFVVSGRGALLFNSHWGRHCSMPKRHLHQANGHLSFLYSSGSADCVRYASDSYRKAQFRSSLTARIGLRLVEGGFISSVPIVVESIRDDRRYLSAQAGRDAR